MTGRVRRWSTGLLGTTVLLLAGCAGVPERSAPQVADEVPTQPNRPRVDFPAPKPEPGDDQRAIVSGFLRAQISPDSDYEAARQFLTPDAAEAWDPGKMVRIVDEKRSYVGTPDDQGDVTVQTYQVGTVAADGSYTATPGAEAARPDEYSFHLVQVDGEWRIADPPNGLILRKSLFDIGYNEYYLYFLDSTQERLVYDVRYFPGYSGGALATILLNGLVAGPSNALAGAVTSPLSKGVRVTGNVVQEQASVLRVNVEGLSAKSEAEQRAAAAQITWTLYQVGTSGVRIVDGGRPLEFDGVQGPSQPGDWQAFSPDGQGLGTLGYYLHEGAVLTTAGAPVEGPAGEGQYPLTSIAVSFPSGQDGGSRRLAGVGGPVGAQRLYLGDLGGGLAPVLQAGTLSTPSWDSTSGDVWTVRDGSVITRVTPSGLPAPVDAEGLAGLEPVHQLRLSRDGARVAIIAGSPAHLYVGRVVHNEAGVQVSVEGLVDVLPGVEEVLDVAWASGTRLVVVATDQSDRVIRTVSVDGARVRNQPRDNLPAPVTEVAAAPSLPTLVVSDNGIWQKAGGSTWLPLLRDRAAPGSAPTYPG